MTRLAEPVGRDGVNREADGGMRAVGSPRSGAENRILHEIGAGYGVLKLLSDPPHWSDNGH